ncbi:ester cyclase [Jatrophihabitans endophyticus]|uniref:ester cyclase n=1 Tax=Jatrophihabitans endophyticus TaxID=1206085 RepID=UPI00190EBAFD|nr:ester cyclase [Jatrophihabitans endophyticus]
MAAGLAALALAGAAPATGASAAGHPVDRITTGGQSKVATASDPHLVHFQHLSIDQGLSPDRARLVVRRIRELYTFWDTGDVRYLHRADSPAFVDRTLPTGRPQGLRGIEQASRTFRAAVPDLRCTVADVLIAGDRVSVRQVYSGHFTGTYNGARGHGQGVRFNAFDIQQVGARQIVGDWHLEDNMTFSKQIGALS